MLHNSPFLLRVVSQYTRYSVVGHDQIQYILNIIPKVICVTSPASYHRKETKEVSPAMKHSQDVVQL